MKNEVNCANSRMFLDYVKEFHPEDYEKFLRNLDPEIDSLPDPEGFLRNPNAWISCSVASRLYARARDILKNEMAAYEITRYGIEKTRLGYVQSIIIRALWSIKTALRHSQRINDKWNRTKKVELLKLKRDQATIRLHWDSGLDLTKDFCLINQAAFTFLPKNWGGRQLMLKERCCFFQGAPYCEYQLIWPAENRLRGIFSRVFTPKSVLLETIKEMEKDKEIVEDKYEEVKQLNISLNRKVEQLVAIQETGKAILSILDLEELLTVIISILSQACRINQAIIMLVNEDRNRLEYLYHIDLKCEQSDRVKSHCVPLAEVSNILARVVNTGLPEYVLKEKTSLQKDNILFELGRSSPVYIVPLITRSKIIGVIAADASDTDARNMLDIFTPQVAIAIENARLYRKLEEQMGEIKRSHTLLCRAEKLSFLGNVAAGLAHEIKNPMTSIGAFLQMLPEKFDDEEFKNDFYQIALEETERINNLIAELLDLAGVKESHFQKTDLHNLIERMILLVSPQTRSKKIKIEKEFDQDLPEILMDEEKMKQAILNLLYNAVEFTPDGGNIEIKTRNVKVINGQGKAIIEIKDSGAGIPADALQKIFDPYFTTRSKSPRSKGTGLGLFIACQNVQDLGGNIDVRSKVDSGTVFTVSVPYMR